MVGRTRPLGISVLAALAALACAIGMALTVAAMAGSTDVHGGALAVVVVALLALASGVTAYGLWTLSWWAWPLAIATWVTGGAQAVASLANGTIDTGLVVAPLAIMYLLTPDIRAAFWRPRGSTRQAVRGPDRRARAVADRDDRGRVGRGGLAPDRAR